MPRWELSAHLPAAVQQLESPQENILVNGYVSHAVKLGFPASAAAAGSAPAENLEQTRVPAIDPRKRRG